jgi:hypothetical protein
MATPLRCPVPSPLSAHPRGAVVGEPLYARLPTDRSKVPSVYACAACFAKFGATPGPEVNAAVEKAVAAALRDRDAD